MIRLGSPAKTQRVNLRCSSQAPSQHCCGGVDLHEYLFFTNLRWKSQGAAKRAALPAHPPSRFASLQQSSLLLRALDRLHALDPATVGNRLKGERFASSSLPRCAYAAQVRPVETISLLRGCRDAFATINKEKYDDDSHRRTRSCSARDSRLD